MRCEYCDYSQDGIPSLYEDGLESSRRHRTVVYRRLVDKYVCGVCWEEGHELPFVTFAEDSPLLVDEWDAEEGELMDYSPIDDDFN